MTIGRVVAVPKTSIGVRSRCWRAAGLSSTGRGWNAGGKLCASTAAGGVRTGKDSDDRRTRQCTWRGGRRLITIAFLRRNLHCNFLDIAVRARMWVALESARRWAAIGIFRFASLTLHCAMNLHQQRRISHNDLRTVLSGTRVLERFGAWLALGRRRLKQQQDERDFHSERID
jgi:hypothetical protein